MATYFWFLGDLFIVCLFAISFTTAYRYIHQRRKLESHGVYSELQIQHRLRRSIYKHVMCKSFATQNLYCTSIRSLIQLLFVQSSRLWKVFGFENLQNVPITYH